MIHKIDHIKNFGIFKDYNWGITDDFKEKNIIYGWNYSGKTTLSRIFSSLREKSLHDGFPAATFRLTHDQGFVDHTNLNTFPYKVAVYNSEYAKENLRLEFDENINAIYFEVGDNAKIASKIKNLEDLVVAVNGSDTLKGQKDQHQKDIDNFNVFEDLFTTEARRIKNDLFSSLIEFNKGHLKSILNRVLPDLKANLIKSKPILDKIARTVLIASPKPALAEISFVSAFDELLTKTTELLSKIPSKSKMSGILEKNAKAYQWAKAGLSLHTKKDNCIFCGNSITDARFDALIIFFQNESSQLKEAITTLLQQISEELILVDTLQIPASVNDFNEGFQDDFVKKEAELKKGALKYKKTLATLNSLLQDKLDKKNYIAVSHKIDYRIYESFQKNIDQMNELIGKNNQFVENFETTIKINRDKYKDHLVAQFLIKESYASKKKKHENAQLKIKSLDDMANAFLREIDVLNASRESDAEGCAQFNAFVQSFLSRDDITIELNPATKKFNLKRDTLFAKNLSEGEKMAISFSHFLVNLKSIGHKGLLQEYIIYIDDPISSLDSNHIFQVNSLLKEIFFDKIPDPQQPKQTMWKLNCRQLFISTHNFEFFNLLKELPKSDGYGKGGKKESKYFINRTLNDSAIENLPGVYQDFPSEYHFLFGQILEFNNSANKSNSPYLLMMPNILRRFVEMYTLTKYPSKEDVDARAEKIFSKERAKRILKLLHHFSHFNSLDRINRHSEFVADIEHACCDLINLIKEKDEVHYLALEAAVS